jgi:hypothetical protein
MDCVLYDYGLEAAVDVMVRSMMYSDAEIVERCKGYAEYRERNLEDRAEGERLGLSLTTVDADVRRHIAASRARLQGGMAAWPARTDTDRLHAAFTALVARGILAVENYEYEALDVHGLLDEIRSRRQRGEAQCGGAAASTTSRTWRTRFLQVPFAFDTQPLLLLAVARQRRIVRWARASRLHSETRA